MSDEAWHERIDMKVAIGSDHGGFEQKAPLIEALVGLGHEVIDMGPHTDESVDYPEYAKLVAEAVSTHQADRGVLICGTGIGMALAADKVSGVRAAPINRADFAQLSRQHNNLNVLCLSGRFVSVEENVDILRAFMETPFEGGRHERRVSCIMDLDKG